MLLSEVFIHFFVRPSPLSHISRCLKRSTHEERLDAYNFWHLDRDSKWDKMRQYLVQAELSSEVGASNSSHVIGGKHYVLHLVLDGHHKYLCPTALARLSHFGLTKLEALAGNLSGDAQTIRNQVSVHKLTKKDIIAEWMNIHIIPECEPDESVPSFKRCELYADVDAVKLAFDQYLVFIEFFFNFHHHLFIY